jgi:hypothetical protein
MSSVTTRYWQDLLNRQTRNAARDIHEEISRRGSLTVDRLLTWYGARSERTGEVYATVLALDERGDILRSRSGSRPKGQITHCDPCTVP